MLSYGARYGSALIFGIQEIDNVSDRVKEIKKYHMETHSKNVKKNISIFN